MHWMFTDEQRMVNDALREWLTATVTLERLRTWVGDNDPSPMWQAFVTGGWAGVGFPESAGGQGGGVVELAMIAERLGYAAAPDAVWLATALASAALGPAELTRALAGDGAALLVDADRIPTAATSFELDGQGRVSGSVVRVLGAEQAQLFVAVVESADGRALRLIDATSEGVRISPQRLLDGTRAIAAVSLKKVESVELAADADATLMRATDLGAVLIAADALGIAQRVLEMSVEYAGQRHQFGVPIGSFQAVKHAAAEMEVGVEAGRSAVYYAAASVEAEVPEGGLQAAAIKAEVGDGTAHAVDTALTLHGAIGYTWEHDLQLFYKRAKLDARLFGSSHQWLDRIADTLLPA